MSAPGTRHFIGPLTPSQQRKRQRRRASFRDISCLRDARNLTFIEALAAYSYGRKLP